LQLDQDEIEVETQHAIKEAIKRKIPIQSKHHIKHRILSKKIQETCLDKTLSSWANQSFD